VKKSQQKKNQWLQEPERRYIVRNTDQSEFHNAAPSNRVACYPVSIPLRPLRICSLLFTGSPPRGIWVAPFIPPGYGCLRFTSATITRGYWYLTPPEPFLCKRKLFVDWVSGQQGIMIHCSKITEYINYSRVCTHPSRGDFKMLKMEFCCGFWR